MIDPFKTPFIAEMWFSKNKGTNAFKIEKGFDTLEEAKTWIKSKLSRSTLSWNIESWGEIILKGQ